MYSSDQVTERFVSSWKEQLGTRLRLISGFLELGDVYASREGQEPEPVESEKNERKKRHYAIIHRTP